MLGGFVAKELHVRVESGDGPLRHVHAPLRCRVLHARGLPDPAGPPGGSQESLELDILQPPHESLRGARLLLIPHEPDGTLLDALKGREVVVDIQLHVPRMGHVADGAGILEPLA